MRASLMQDNEAGIGSLGLSMDTLAKARGALGAGDIPSNAFLPAEAPLDMAVQPLRRFEPPPAASTSRRCGPGAPSS